MAEALTRKILADNLQVPADELDRKGLSIVSAGAVAMPGSRASSEAVEAVRNLGADLARHRSRTLSVELINQADMIFTMGRSHARAVTSLVPGSADKVETLNPTGDIEDPIGSDVAVYQALARRMQDLIHDRLAEHGVLKSE